MQIDENANGIVGRKIFFNGGDYSDLFKIYLSPEEKYLLTMNGYIVKDEENDFSEEELNEILQNKPKVNWEDYSLFRKMNREELLNQIPPLRDLLPEDSTIETIFLYATRNVIDDEVSRYDLYMNLSPLVQELFDRIYLIRDHDSKYLNPGAVAFAKREFAHPLETYLLQYDNVMGSYSQVSDLLTRMGLWIDPTKTQLCSNFNPLYQTLNNDTLEEDYYDNNQIDLQCPIDPDKYFLLYINKYLDVDNNNNNNSDIPSLEETLTFDRNQFEDYDYLFPDIDPEEAYKKRLLLIIDLNLE
jgi:hypothetical protein